METCDNFYYTRQQDYGKNKEARELVDVIRESFGTINVLTRTLVHTCNGFCTIMENFIHVLYINWL